MQEKMITYTLIVQHQCYVSMIFKKNTNWNKVWTVSKCTYFIYMKLMLYVLLLNWIFWCNDRCHKSTRIAGIPDLILSFVPEKIKWELPKIARNKYNPLNKRNENWQKSARNKTSMRTDKKCAKQKLKENSEPNLLRYFNMARLPFTYSTETEEINIRFAVHWIDLHHPPRQFHQCIKQQNPTGHCLGMVIKKGNSKGL